MNATSARRDFFFDSGIAFEAQARRSLVYVLAAVAMVGGIVAWSATARVETIVRGEGRIIPSARSQFVQHLEGGIVRELAVREGDDVRKGQLLLTIDPTRADATLAERKAQRTGFLARSVRLLAVAEGRATLEFDDSIDSSSPVARAEIEAFRSWQQQISQETRVLREQVRQKEAEIDSHRSREESLTAEMEVAKKQLAVVQTMYSRRSASRMEYLEAQARLRRYQTQVQEAQTAVPKLSAAIREIRERMRELQARAQVDARTELAQVRTEIERIDQEIRGESDRVARTEVRSPVDGIVNRIYVNTIGGVVRPGDSLVELTPSDDKVLIEAHIRPADRANLRAGIRASARVSAFDSVRFGRLAGEVVEVSADTVPDENGRRFYRVRVAVDARDSPIPRDELRPGLTATADIVTGDRTILEYLASPVLRFGDYALSEP